MFLFLATREVKPDKTYFYNDFKDYLQNKGDAEILVLGNSKALSSLSSPVIHSETNNKTYNMSYAGANLEFTRNLLISYLKNALHKPSICILEVSWFSFSRQRTSYPHDKPQLDLKICNTKQIFNSMRHNRAAIIKNMAKQFASTKSSYIDWWDGDPKKAGTVFDVNNFNVKEMYEVFPKLEAGVDQKLLECYRDIITICKSNNIELIVYTAPEALVYIQKQKDRELVKSLILKSVQEHDIEYMDFSADGKNYSSKLDGMLYDSHHVRRTEDFTKLFLETLIKQKCEIMRGKLGANQNN
jgi:hypothetical protein